MTLDKRDIKKHFPKLAKEIESSETRKVKIGGVRWSETDYYKELTNPDVISFLRRCDTEKQALEIIDYLENREEITSEYADVLRHQLKTGGVRSFGPKKTWGYFERIYRKKEKRKKE